MLWILMFANKINWQDLRVSFIMSFFWLYTCFNFWKFWWGDEFVPWCGFHSPLPFLTSCSFAPTHPFLLPPKLGFLSSWTTKALLSHSSWTTKATCNVSLDLFHIPPPIQINGKTQNLSSAGELYKIFFVCTNILV